MIIVLKLEMYKPFVDHVINDPLYGRSHVGKIEMKFLERILFFENHLAELPDTVIDNICNSNAPVKVVLTEYVPTTEAALRRKSLDIVLSPNNMATINEITLSRFALRAKQEIIGHAFTIQDGIAYTSDFEVYTAIGLETHDSITYPFGTNNFVPCAFRAKKENEI